MSFCRTLCAFALASVLVASNAVVVARADDRSFEIGVDLPLSGIDGADGVPSRNAVALAIDEENERGFPGGFHAVIDDLDDTVQGKHDPAQGSLNIKTFASDARVLAMVGPLNSSVAKAQIPVSNATSLTMISNGATAIELTHGVKARLLRGTNPDTVTFFRVCASDDRQGGLMAGFSIAHGWKRVYAVDDNEAYGRGIADVFVSELARGGGTVLGREHILPFQFDFKSSLTKIAALHPQAVFFGGVTSTGGGILRKEMGDVGLGTVPYLGGDGLDSPQFTNLAGRSADNTYYSIGAPQVTRIPSAAPFVNAFRARYHSTPDSYATGAYSGARIELEAIRALLARNSKVLPSREDVRAAIAATHGVETPLGALVFDRAGDIEHPTMSVYRVIDGKSQFIAQTTVR